MSSSNSHDLNANADRILWLGKTATGNFIPIKVVDDGAGLGKVVINI